jgi:hypothetical protein
MIKQVVVCILVFLLAPGVLAENTKVSGKAPQVYSVGLGGGYESGSGLTLGLCRDANKMHTTVGLLYNGEEARLMYSIGLRYIRYLARGAINDTYAWAGSGVHGERESEYNDYTAGFGVGLGIELHLGLPFHINIDSGYHITRDSEDEITVGPTVNGSLTYNWGKKSKSGTK